MSERIKTLIRTGQDGRYPSRSEALFAVLLAMIAGGHSDDEMASVALTYPIGEKAQEQGMKWLEGEIARARWKHQPDQRHDDGRHGQTDGQATSEQEAADAAWEPVAAHVDDGRLGSRTAGFSIVSARDLLTREWLDPPWMVPGLLPVGLTLLAGRPKVGKSWLALQLMQAVATGGMFLGERVERAPCLYLALEDSPRRLSGRMKAQGWRHMDVTADFVTVGQAGNLLPLNGRSGGAEALALLIATRDYRLVVIDTLSRALAGDQNDAHEMTAALSPLQVAAHTQGCAVVVVDHHNKMGAANLRGADGEASLDPVLNILGSTAKGAMADAIMGLYRASGKAGAVLAIIGRDVEEKQLLLKQDGVTKCWQCEGDADAVRVSEARRVVWDAVKEMGETTCTELAEILGRNKGSVLKDLVRLVSDGLLLREGNTYKATER